MAKCKLCKTNIPDGTEYCENCQDKGTANSNESYLDSLLNSVKNIEPSTENIYKKKSELNKVNIDSPEIVSNKVLDSNSQDFDAYKFDLSDIEDFDQFNLDDDLKNHIIIGDEDLFGTDLSNIFSDENSMADESYKKSTKVIELAKEPQELETIKNDLEEDMYNVEAQIEEQEEGPKDLFKTQDDLAAEALLHNQASDVENQVPMQDDIPLEQTQSNISKNEILEYQEDDNNDLDLNVLLNILEASNEESNDNTMSSEADDMRIEDDIDTSQEFEEDFQQEDEDEDFLSLLNQISSDDPVSDDVRAISDLLSGKPVEIDTPNMLSDVGEVFSDALKVVSSLNDPSIDEIELLSKIPDKKNKKVKKSKKDKQKLTQVEASLTEEPKKGLFKRLFANVEDENALKKNRNIKKLNEEDSAATKEVTKGGKSKKNKKGAVSNVSEESIEEFRPGKDRSENELPADLKVSKKDKKKDKKDKKKKTKEIIQVIDEIEEDEGRINRMGASIVFLFFGLLVILLIVGTNVVSYTLSIQNATNYFDKQKYTQAYNEVYGIEIKDEDIEIYDKIMTVMFVNKQLNSYNNYYSMKEYPAALDSLLKGLSRYDKYIELATMLGIKTDLDYVRSQILAEINNVFNLSEKEALQMIDYENMEEYSLKVYDVVLEKMNN